MAQSETGYFIEKIEDGGFIVCPPWNVGGVRWPVFACTDIDVALLYIKDRLRDAASS